MQSALEDRLSALPDEILLRILSLTESYKTAVICSLISKRWMLLYTRLPWLCFTFGDDVKPNLSGRVKKFEKIVNSALFRHRGRLESFQVNAGYYYCSDKIEEWLRYGGSHDVQHLSLIYDCCLNFNRVPVSLYSCATLVTLYLEGFRVKKFPRLLTEFPSLIKCHLVKTEIRDLSPFLSKCPQLQHLLLEGCYLPSHLTISSQNLTTLHIKSDHVYLAEDNTIYLQLQCPKIQSISLEGSFDPFQIEGFNMFNIVPPQAQFMAEKPGLVSLKARVGTDIKNHDLFLGSVKCFSTLETLELSTVSASPSSFWHMLTGLPLLNDIKLCNCQFLQEDNMRTEENVVEKKEVMLRNVYVDMHVGSPGEKQMLRLLTKQTPMLQKLNVTLRRRWLYDNDTTYLSLLKQFLKLQVDGFSVSILDSTQDFEETIAIEKVS
eukprot:TRINITY_DN2222_c0_g2_i1.p1 TRINITY_DN2222_c0_g2~~TRINITY_DN2222_c0_g2_i1.p1  ORF type:complete len:434 (-),score=68.22 TRINITY_DN2222_c0_g2_i1:162-1463(-)